MIQAGEIAPRKMREEVRLWLEKTGEENIAEEKQPAGFHYSPRNTRSTPGKLYIRGESPVKYILKRKSTLP
ncbi:unnamed protein product [Allacma fusca]|uniref:Uncharacterized protein n=1 Tax=Allacma fusca TaxID=39272 RepID=A0A8J2KBZ1_9HEXA|nr:unnamed protein product [Allacma fusca]